MQLNEISISNSTTNFIEAHKEYENVTDEKNSNTTSLLRENNLLTLHCSNDNVKCIKVVCNLVPIRSQDVGKFTLPLVLDVTQFKGIIFNHFRIIL